MSGPKVVRVVTREELVESGETLLGKLDLALAAWREECASFMAIAAADTQMAIGRREELERLLRADKFGQFERAATAEIGFLEADTCRRREAAAQAVAVDRARQMSGRQIAKVLLRADAQVAADVRLDLERALRGELSVSELDRVLSKATSALHSTQDPVLSGAQKELAARLGDGQAQSIEDWKAQRSKVDKRLQELHAGVAELEYLGDSVGAADAQRMLDQAQMSPDRAERSMRLDSLQMVIHQAKALAMTRTRLLKQTRILVAELSKLGSSTCLPRLLALNASLETGEIEEAHAAAQAELEVAQRARAAIVRRQVILNGLGQLGYTVHEGLSTAVAEGGRLVVRSPDRSGYGVEVLASGDTARMQVRSVALDGARDTAQDVKEEERWCDDFGKLRADLTSQGCDVVVEKALGVGKVAIKVISSTDSGAERRSAASATKKSAR